MATPSSWSRSRLPHSGTTARGGRSPDVEAPHVAALPWRLDGVGVVVAADPRRRLLGTDAAQLRDAGQRRSGAAAAATADDIHARARESAAVGLDERRSRVDGI